MIIPLLCDPFYPSFGADLLIAFLGAVLSLGAAYFIYLLSIWQVRRDRLKYVVSLIEEIVLSAILQSQHCAAHAELMAQQPFSNENLQLEANRDPKRLADKVDQEGVYHAYLWKYKRSDETYKDFRKLYGYIDYIDYLIDDLIKTNERVLTFTWERKKQYQLTYKNATQAIQSLTLIPELQQNQRPLIDYAGNLLEQFVKNQPNGESIVQSYQMVVEPLSDHIVANAQQHPKITELLFLLHDLSNQYRGIELSAAHNATDYKDYAEKLKAAAGILLESTQKLRKDFSTDKPKSN
jgi:hypothetical protein